jgi:predicted metal-dependent HD superfamily phosphohydrolase
MKYHFNCNYCIMPKMANLLQIEQDFTNNLSGFLYEIGVEPKTTAYAVAKSVYWRMTCNKLRFHNPIHILACFQMYQNLVLDNMMGPLSTVQELALWLHDIAYHKKGTTRYSRDLAIALMEPWMGNTYQLGQLIDAMSSNFHDCKDVIKESKILLDLDLYYLACEQSHFYHILDLQQDEEPDVSDDDYKVKMYGLFEVFKNRETIFRTSTMSPYEKFARRNIEHALELMAYT